jgi:hypothetical protein
LHLKYIPLIPYLMAGLCTIGPAHTTKSRGGFPLGPHMGKVHNNLDFAGCFWPKLQDRTSFETWPGIHVYARLRLTERKINQFLNTF